MHAYDQIQPPSGGCVLKLLLEQQGAVSVEPAAFGRLCVETGGKVKSCRRLFASRLQAAIYQYNSEISYNKGRLKTLSIGFQTTFFSHQHKPDTLE